MPETQDLRIESTMSLITPDELRRELPISASQAALVASARAQIEAIVHGRDPRLLVMVGPCSLHDPDAALDYARRLAAIVPRFEDALFICMRGYFEKPRTSVGWK